MVDIKTKLSKSILAKIFCSLFGLFAIMSLGAFAYNQVLTARYAGLSDNQGIITVTGTGYFTAIPKESIVYVNLSATASTSKQAKDTITAQAQKVLNICKDLNINKKDINSGSFSISPHYTWENDQRVFKGYKAYQNIQIKVHNTKTAERLLGRLADSGITSINYSNHIDDKQLEKLRSKAKIHAIQNARLNAKQLATVLGVHLGKLISYSEGGDHTPFPQPVRMTAKDSASNEEINPHLPTGEQEHKVTVTLKYKVW